MNKQIKNTKGFKQNEILLENEYSTTLKYTYPYHGEERIGYVCWLNPFVGKLTIGVPGSGKTIVSTEEDIKQFIRRGYAAVIYDHKSGLSQLAYDCLIDSYKKNKNITPQRFGYISFNDLSRTQRCNPMKGITTLEEAADCASILLKQAEKHGDFSFYKESNKTYITLNIYALSLLFNGKYQSLPHLLSLIGREITTIIPLLKLLSIFYPEMRSPFVTLNELYYEHKAIEQIKNQLKNACTALVAMNSPTLCFVMTEDDEHPENNVSIEVNNPNNPLVLCIESNYTSNNLESSIYLTRIAKAINKGKSTPTLFSVDELPTVFIKDLDGLIATSRGRKIAVSLGIQDFSQLIRDYGKESANAIISICKNIMCGATKDDTALKLSEIFGKNKISQKTIENLPQGEFVGQMADEFSTHQRIKHKIFHGKFSTDNTPKGKNKIPKQRNFTDEELYDLTTKEQIKINNQVTELFTKTGKILHIYEHIREETMLLPPIKTQKGSKEQPEQKICLERFVNDPDNPKEQSQFYLWLCNAYALIKELDKIKLTNDTLSFEEKFNLLLLDVFKAGEDKIQIVHQYRRLLNVMTLENIFESMAEK